MAGAGLLSYVLHSWFLPTLGVLLILQLAVVPIALLGDWRSSVFSGILGATTFNYFFTNPQLSLKMNEADDVIGIVVFLTTALMTTQLARFYKIQQKALQMEQLRSSILLSVSHDLRTPLSSIIGNLSSLKEYGARLSSDEQDELLTAAIFESHRLHDYIENLLQATKLQYQELSYPATLQNIGDIVESSSKRFKNDRIVIERNGSIPFVKVRPALIEQAFYNVIDNALKYTPPASPIIITVASLEGHVEVRIEDKGRGVKNSSKDKIFDLFYTEEVGDRRKGSGLGLPVAKSLTEANNGSLCFDTSPSGASFKFRFPVS
jgi:K+-sensing histidine kinase KdpD